MTNSKAVKKIMKRRFWMAGLLLAAWAGCSDDSFKEYPSEENVDDNIPVPVQLSLGKAAYSASTRGLTGAVDEQEEGNEVWQNAKVYVYAFLKDMTGRSFEEGMSPDNVGGVSSVSASCLIDGSLDASNPLAGGGKEADVLPAEGELAWSDRSETTKTLYYPAAQEPYTFYAYYIDTLAYNREMGLAVNRTQDSIEIRNIQISGTQDLMHAVASEATDEQLGALADPEEAAMVRETAFSAYSARRGVQPEMSFRHLLSRLKFEIYPGAKEADDVVVKTVRVESMTRCRFTVVHVDPAKMGLNWEQDSREFLQLRDENGAPLTDHLAGVADDGTEVGGYRPNPFEPGVDPFSVEPVQVGESMLLAPDESYRISILFDQTGQATDGSDIEMPGIETAVAELRLDGGAAFEAGRQYNIRVVIYGVQKISVSATVVPWEDGGTVDVTEDDFEEGMTKLISI